jgi:hypothetical protein
MKYQPEDYPNLWRIVCEISKCNEPDRVLNDLLAVAKSVLKEENHDE